MYYEIPYKQWKLLIFIISKIRLIPQNFSVPINSRIKNILKLPWNSFLGIAYFYHLGLYYTQYFRKEQPKMTNQISLATKQYFYWFFIQRTGKELFVVR